MSSSSPSASKAWLRKTKFAMLNTKPRRFFTSRARPKAMLLLAMALVTVYMLSSREAGGYHVVPFTQEPSSMDQKPTPLQHEPLQMEPESTTLQNTPHTSIAQESAPQPTSLPLDGGELAPIEEIPEIDPAEKERQRLREEKEKHEQALRDEFRAEYERTAGQSNISSIYGNTIATLISKGIRSKEHDAMLKEAPKKPLGFDAEQTFIYNPYPEYNSGAWRDQHRAPYVACEGATGEPVEDMVVFKGHPNDFPAESFGSYEALNIDGNICFERETRLGPYGFTKQLNKDGNSLDWDEVKWGDLQRSCVKRNSNRFDMKGKPNQFLDSVYARDNNTTVDASAEVPAAENVEQPPLVMPVTKQESTEELRSEKESGRRKRRAPALPKSERNSTSTVLAPESRTAILLRSYTGKNYTENDKQIMRSLVTELSLRSGGEYEVFLLLHVRDSAIEFWNDDETYQYVLQQNVPPEFHDMTILWNDEIVWSIYSALTDEHEKSVHSAQWLSVQTFSQENPEFDFVWNWEMDARFTGHHYDFLEKLDAFARKQPRRGLWERNERYYIPSLHGDYDHGFRNDVESRTRGSQVWGPPALPFINPVGPKPPVETPEEDDYQWGVGENADLITVGPIFNPVDSEWIIGNDVWGYKDDEHPSITLPRRTTIVTQSRISKRLLDIMHVENLRGNHVASEMTPQTVALLHGLKAVFAPQPVWFDRPWNGTFLAKWFNPGPRGETGGKGSPMGWGRERRYQGATWYYRTEPPVRLYNNWIGYEDTGIGGAEWERKHGRTCLPPMLIHPIKDVRETPPGFKTKFDLPYG